MASPPYGAGPHSDHESAAGCRPERRSALQEAVVGKRTAATRILPTSSVGEPAAARVAGVARSVESNHRGAEPGGRAGSREAPEAQRLATHPGVGPLTALAFVLIIGKAERFSCGKQIASYLGLVPLEDSSGNRRRLGHITKQGSSMLRFLLVEAAQVTVRSLPEWRSKYFHLMMRRGEDCQDRHGTALGCSSVLDAAPGVGLSAVEQVRFARGQPGNRHWRGAEHRVIELAPRSSF